MLETCQVVGGKYSLPEFGDGGRDQVHRVLAQMRIGDVRLDALHPQAAMQGAAAAVLHHVAEAGHAGGFADDAGVDALAACGQPFHHAHRAVDGRAFLVRGDQPGDGTGVLRMFGQEMLDSGKPGGDGALHVGRAAAIELPIAFQRQEGIAAPLFQRAGGDHVGVAGEADQGRRLAAARPEIAHAALVHGFHGEAECLQADHQPVLAAGVNGRDGTACDQFARVVEDLTWH
jgi:hypothetical protein